MLSTFAIHHLLISIRRVIHVGLFFSAAMSAVFAPPRDNYHIEQAQELSEIEAVQYLFSMRNSAYAESYVFRFKLKHFPYRSRAFTYYGTLYGRVEKTAGRQIERILIQDRDPSNPREFVTLKDMLLIRGQTAEAWVFSPNISAPTNSTSIEVDENDPQSSSSENESPPSNKTETPNVLRLESADLNQTILSTVSLTYFDLLVPYFYWREYDYTGPEQVKARPTQSFRLFNPDKAASIRTVALELDDEFRAILKASYLDKEEETLKSMELVAFKKTSGSYIPKTIDYRDAVERGNKTRIDIVAAAMEITLPDGLFDPQNLGQPIPDIDPFVFDVF